MIKIICDYCLEEIVNPSDENQYFREAGHFHDRELGDCLDLWLLTDPGERLVPKPSSEDDLK